MAAKSGLGRGLGVLLNNGAPAAQPAQDPAKGKPVRMLQVRDLKPSDWQPRRHFDSESLDELTQSVREHGILQPLLVRQTPEGPRLIAGERRLRAAIAAGLAEVPAIVMEASDATALELALVENLQRRDLDPVEEAEGYDLLMKRFGLTQEQAAERVGKARATVANALRLLELPPEVRDLLGASQISAGHAKLLAGLTIPAEQVLLARRAAREQLSVRQLERIVKRTRAVPTKPRAARHDIPETHLAYLGEQLHRHFATSVRLTPCKTLANGKKQTGCIAIDYHSADELDRILALLGVQID
ncbi:MAG: ParB/RepB/Spo0J family partition protein [Lentisphaerae bacterium]|nr:ParB/RepB/Spo0J family partition protein [Lentisphaerota bacterium]